MPFRAAVRAWFAISLQTFGGPAGQIAVMQRTLVDEKRWIGQRRFLHALNYCMLLPGPGGPAARRSTSAGCSTALRGGLVAGILFVLPGVVALLGALGGLRRLRRHHGGHRAVRRARAGGAGDRGPGGDAGRAPGAARTRRWSALAVAAFVALAVFAVPFPVVIAGRGRPGLVRWAGGSRPLAAAAAHGGDATTARRR